MKGKIHYVVVMLILIVATFLGIFGQGISYYIKELFPTINLATAITSVTFKAP